MRPQSCTSTGYGSNDSPGVTGYGSNDSPAVTGHDDLQPEPLYHALDRDFLSGAADNQNTA